MTDNPSHSPAPLFDGPGDVRALCRALDWSATPLGPAAAWSQGLQLAVRLCLDCKTAMALWLGSEFVLVHNDAYAEVLGNKFPEALGRPLREVWSEVWLEIAADFQRVLTLGESIRYDEAKFRLLRGEHESEAYFSYSLTPLRDADGQVFGIFNVLEETTAFVRARIEREHEYRTLFNRIDEGLCIVTPIYDDQDNPLDFRFIELNPAFEHQTGYTNAIGRTAREVNPQLEAVWPTMVCEVASSGEPLRLEGLIRGLERWFEVLAFRIDDERNGRVALLFNDITPRKLSQDALERSEGRMRALVTASSDRLYRMTADWGEICQLPARELVGKMSTPTATWLDEYIPADERSRVTSAIREALRSKETFELEHRVVRADGSEGWTFSRAVPLLDIRGEIVEWIGAASDITERKRAQLELEQLNAQLCEADTHKNEFLAVLSHELRNPLAPIRNSLYILDRVPPNGTQARRAKLVIARQVDQLAHLVDDLLDVTRISRGKIQLQRRRLELNELVTRTLEDHRSLFENTGVTLRLIPAKEPVFVNADWSRITQVLGNLLQNAAKFTTPSGSVTVALSVEASTASALVCVSDTGLGISPEILARLFVPFTQADASLDRSKGGLGLGLALVKSLVELHQGSVEAKSAGIGRGSQFSVRLPLDTAPPNEHALARASSAVSRRRVLIIEDNADAATTLREVLELQGHQVAVAYDGPDGIEKAREFLPDVVFCDIGLPGMDGYSVARTLCAEPKDHRPKLVAVSGYALPEDRDRAAAAGFDRHIAKPPSVDELTDVLEETLLERQSV